MKLASVLLLFSLFHHSGTSKKETMRFIRVAVDTIRSYQDGSVNEALETDRIREIEENLVVLNEHPRAASNVRLMSIVTQEIAALRDYDDTLQRSLMEQFKPEPIA